MNESKIQYFHNTYIHCLSYYVIPTYVVYTFYNVHGTYTITKQLFRIRRVSGCFCLIVCLIQAAGLGSLLIIQELRLPENAARLRFVMFSVYVHSTMYTAQCGHVVHGVCTQYNVHCTVCTLIKTLDMFYASVILFSPTCLHLHVLLLFALLCCDSLILKKRRKKITKNSKKEVQGFTC